jgi:hypothetical protein
MSHLREAPHSQAILQSMSAKSRVWRIYGSDPFWPIGISPRFPGRFLRDRDCADSVCAFRKSGDRAVAVCAILGAVGAMRREKVGNRRDARQRFEARGVRSQPVNNSRIQSLVAQSRTDFPLPSFRLRLTPWWRKVAMIWRWAAFASLVPLPPRPVVCTAR